MIITHRTDQTVTKLFCFIAFGRIEAAMLVKVHLHFAKRLKIKSQMQRPSIIESKGYVCLSQIKKFHKLLYQFNFCFFIQQLVKDESQKNLPKTVMCNFVFFL